MAWTGRGCLLAIRILAACAAALAGFAADPRPAGAEEAAAGALDPFRVEFTAGLWLGSLRGNLQTPAGGMPGTTSPNRPRIDEVGLEGYHFLPLADLLLEFQEEHGLHASYAGIDIEGSDVLPSALVSQNVVFPAGAPVESSLELHMLRFGYRASWLELDLRGWRFTPELGFGHFLFGYTLTSPAAAGRADRSYGISFPYFGLEMQKSLLADLDLELALAGCPLINGVTLLDVEARLAWRILEREGFSLSLLLGLRGAWFRRQDSQPVPNDPTLLIGAFSTEPWGGLTFGVRLGGF
jgi:hypothetical protein